MIIQLLFSSIMDGAMFFPYLLSLGFGRYHYGDFAAVFSEDKFILQIRDGSVVFVEFRSGD